MTHLSTPNIKPPDSPSGVPARSVGLGGGREVGLPTASFQPLLDRVPHPFLFVTVSGAHLYGFPSVDSDWDLRASHLLPGTAFWSLHAPQETEQEEAETDAGLVELVSHDLLKFSRLLVKRNGYVLEQLTSPWVVHSTPAHRELVDLVPGLLTRHHFHHYRGFYSQQRREYERSQPRSLKKLLYCYRVLMTGTVLLREGTVEANLTELNRQWEFPFLAELIERKAAGELGTLEDDAPYVKELPRLDEEMERAFVESPLPEAPPAREELDRLIVRIRGAS